MSSTTILALASLFSAGALVAALSITTTALTTPGPLDIAYSASAIASPANALSDILLAFSSFASTTRGPTPTVLKATGAPVAITTSFVSTTRGLTVLEAVGAPVAITTSFVSINGPVAIVSTSFISTSVVGRASITDGPIVTTALEAADLPLVTTSALGAPVTNAGPVATTPALGAPVTDAGPVATTSALGAPVTDAMDASTLGKGAALGSPVMD
mmetsp:Transcript_39857/g.70085  ORF Transcript_39857/g.70085 Transcript_39857/m.70085 type:complete len:215 (+) Transcript_39857:2057-2701(+)